MKRYQVSYEIRQRGAIGVWGVGSKTVEAGSVEQATAEAMLLLHADGWELRQPVNMLEIMPEHYASNPLSGKGRAS